MQLLISNCGQATLSIDSLTCHYSMPHFYYLRMHINTCTAERSANTEPAIPDCLDGNYLFAPCWKVNKLGARHSWLCRTILCTLPPRRTSTHVYIHTCPAGGSMNVEARHSWLFLTKSILCLHHLCPFARAKGHSPPALNYKSAPTFGITKLVSYRQRT